MEFDKNDLELLKDEIKTYAKWLKEHHSFVTQIFEYPELRQGIESLPSVIYDIASNLMKVKELNDDLVTDASLFLSAVEFFTDFIDICEFVYNDKKDFNRLVKQHKLLNLLLLAQDVLDFLTVLEEQEKLELSSQNQAISDLITEVANTIYENKKEDENFIAEGYEIIDKIIDSLPEDYSFTPMSYLYEEISLERNIPLINLDLLSFAE